MIHMIIAMTTTTAIIPATAPALNIPVITEQLLSVNSTNANDKKCKFFMIND